MNSYYFSHDYSTRMDAKIKQLIKRHGMEGYGIYWAIIEELYANANALQTDSESIAYDLRCDADKVESILYDFDLFYNNCYGGISSHGIDKRISEIKEKSLKARKSANLRWHKDEKTPQQQADIKDDNANALQPECERNAINKIKLNKIKENKRKVNEIIDYLIFDEFTQVNITQKEYDTLIAKHGKKIADACISKLHYYKLSHGKKYKSDYGAINMWVVGEVKKEIPPKKTYQGAGIISFEEQQKLGLI